MTTPRFDDEASLRAWAMEIVLGSSFLLTHASINNSSVDFVAAAQAVVDFVKAGGSADGATDSEAA